MNHWRFIDLGITDPFVLTAMAEVLLVARKRKLIPLTLCLYVPTRCVVVGPRTSLRKQVNMEYCRKNSIPIVRETRGGTVLVLDGNTLWFNLLHDPPGSRIFMDCLVKSLQFMDLEAHVRPNSNDILVGGKKVSGSDPISPTAPPVFSGTMIIDFNYDFCEEAILPRPELFARNKAKSHREYLTTLKTQLGREVSYSEVVSAFKKGFGEVLQVEFDTSNSLTEAEEQILEDLLKNKFHSEEWLKYGKWSPVKDYWRPE